MYERRNKNRIAAVAVMMTLAFAVACDSTNDPINPGGGGGGGGAADIDVVSSTPASGDTNISGSGVSVSSSLENGGATTRVQVDATTGGNVRQVLVYFTTATGAVENVSYFWGTASLLENIVYCPAAGCTNASVNTSTREITFAGTALDNHGAINPTDPPTKFATIGNAVPASMVVYPAP